ncbi:glycosyltransferase [Parabacteroides sp. BX2]|jgi:glycosyltransferase involved in cell wall biosynthesis|uniref:Glycosyltransferase n=1 Tax=Parabacteroides segnis TaxID=2763058 RepID=A0ABR7E7V3_9BACT|nr:MULTISPECIES: glycosyltransferase [Parabacteroides]MBC5645214.1 glycosyltransferase [Parabacteroides segnis]MCM0712765.1 glycosyltransferase [Parabacteroides sp. TA-V-105]
MKILHVIPFLSVESGGPAVSTLLPVRYLNRMGENSKILTFRPPSGETVLSEESFICYLPELKGWRRRVSYSSRLKEMLGKDTDTDVYHIQGLWQYPVYLTAHMACKKQIPYVITLRGMLYPEALKQSAVIKKLALSFFQRRQLQEATCVQATCEEEMHYYREMGFTNPVAIIPNPVELEPLANDVSKTDDIKRFGYLGRIHPRKHIERLIDCWQRLDEPGELVIMGDGDNSYVDSLKEKVRKAQLKRIRFTGLVTGNEKNRLLASLSCLVVPSDFENFGRIIPEALMQSIPVIASTGTPWQELETCRCGWWVKNDTETLTDTMRKVLACDKGLLDEMGERGRQLVLKKYTVEKVSGQLEVMYDWVTGKMDKPDFIYY